MKKHTIYLIFILAALLKLPSNAQTTTGYWVSPINQVPFLITSLDSNLAVDSLITEFSGEPTYYVDSLTGAKIWNPISDSTYLAIFGYNAPLGGNPIFFDYYDLFTIPIDTSYWNLTLWDTLVDVEPWIMNRSILLNSGDMGAIVGWDWYSMTALSAFNILDPTVPVIEGEDLDYYLNISNAGHTMVFDIDDYYTNTDEIQAVITHGVYTFNKPDFKDTYDDFVQWMITTKPFYPHTFDFDTYHEWLYEYFNPIAQTKITEILSTPEYQNTVVLFHVSKNVYALSGNLTNPKYNLVDIQGKVVKSGQLDESNQFEIDEHLPKGIYFLNLNHNGFKSVHKIVK